MSVTSSNEELTLKQLDEIAGGQDGGISREEKLGDKELNQISRGQDGGIGRELEGELGDDELAKVSGGQGGGLRHEFEGEVSMTKLHQWFHRRQTQALEAAHDRVSHSKTGVVEKRIRN